MIAVKSITTKYGTARLSTYGYWQIVTHKQGNDKKKLHRLFYEDYYKCTLLPNAVIHHKDGNKLNNRIDNLEIMSRSDHMRLHQTGRKHSEETINKLINSSNTSGFYRVGKQKQKDYPNGLWRYIYYGDDGKRKKLARKSLTGLKKAVIAKNMVWKIIDENNALNTCKKYGYDLKELI